MIAPTRDAQPTRFVDKILALRQRRVEDFPGEPLTVYLGGGTPSQLDRVQLQRLLHTIVPTNAVEVTLEANPEDIDESWLKWVIDAGVTRLSLGVQTFDAKQARQLGRAHTPAHARKALDLVNKAGITYSVDLMFGLPEQHLHDFQHDLDSLLQYEPPHLSAYGLTIEPDTGFARAQARGQLQPAHESLWVEMYQLLVQRCAAAGLERYEISNFAKTGHHAIHNSGYWQARPYLGLGPGAHSLATDGRRWCERPHVAQWLELSEPREDIEEPSPQRTASDMLISGLRAMVGVNLSLLQANSGMRISQKVLMTMQQHNLIIQDDTTIALTDTGILVADAVTSALIQGLDME